MSRDNHFQIGKYYVWQQQGFFVMQLKELRPCTQNWGKIHFPNHGRCQFCSGHRLYFKGFGESCQSDLEGNLYFKPVFETNERW